MMESKLRFPRSGTAGVVLLYAVFAGLWILLSDRVVALLFTDLERMTLVSSLKGLAFVAVTSLLLFILLRRFGAAAVSASEADDQLRFIGQLSHHWSIIAIFLLLTALIAFTGWSTFEVLSRSLKQRQNAELLATAELKAKQVEAWLGECRSNILQLSEDPLYIDTFFRWRSNGDARLGQLLYERLESNSRNFNLASIELFDLSGKRLLAAGDYKDNNDETSFGLIRQAVSQKKPLIIDIHRHNREGLLSIAHVAIIWSPKPSSQPLGAIIFNIDPTRELYPLVQAWPRPSSSGETMIVRREGDEVVFLNRLRHTDKPPLSIRFPMTQTDLPAVKAILYGPGLYEGRDYRGVPVLAALLKVSGTPWTMVAKIDQAEVYQGIRLLSLFITGLTLVVILACGGLLFMVWRQQRLREALALRQSEERFRIMYESSLDAIMTLGPPDWNFTAGNPATIALFGAKDADEFIHTAPWNLSPEYQPNGEASTVKAKRMIDAAMEKGSHLFEWIHKKIGGETFSATVLLTRMTAEGKTFLQATVRDITEEKRVKDSLFAAKQEWERTFNSVTDLIAIIDAHHRILRVNRAMAQHLGRAPEDCIGLTCHELVHGTSEPPDFCPHRRTMCDDCQHSEEVYEERLGGIFTVTTTPIRNEEGQILGSVHIARDITERKRIEGQREQYHYRLESILDAAGEGIFGLDEEGKITFVNPAAMKLFGYSEEELIGRKSHDVFHGNRQDGTAYPWTDCPNCRTMQDGKSRSGEEVYYRKDGGSFPVEYNCTAISEAGRVTGVVVTFRDVSDRKKLEEQLRQSQKMEAIGQLAGGVAHDFNNILSAIIGYGNLAQMKLSEDHLVRHDLEQILQAAERATALTQSLLAFSRKQPLRIELIELRDIIHKFEKFLLRLLREDIELTVQFADEKLTVMGDRGQIEQVVMNLVTNARDAMPEKGRLCIETASVVLEKSYQKIHGYGQQGEFALISVSDTGMGMDDRTKQKIFEPFFTTKEQGKGTGLGLATVYGIIKAHKGFIDVYSEPGHGTTFKVYLPLVRSSALLESELQRPEPLIGGTETILIAEDDESLRRLISVVLSHMGYRVIEAVDGNDAVEKYVRYKDSISIVILDGIMPGLNGKEVYREILALCPDIPCLFISGYPEDIFTKDGIPLEEVDFLMKPITPSVLLNTVREILDRDITKAPQER